MDKDRGETPQRFTGLDGVEYSTTEELVIANAAYLLGYFRGYEAGASLKENIMPRIDKKLISLAQRDYPSQFEAGFRRYIEESERVYPKVINILDKDKYFNSEEEKFIPDDPFEAKIRKREENPLSSGWIEEDEKIYPRNYQDILFTFRGKREPKGIRYQDHPSDEWSSFRSYYELDEQYRENLPIDVEAKLPKKELRFPDLLTPELLEYLSDLPPLSDPEEDE